MGRRKFLLMGRKDRRMIDKSKFRNLKGRRIYLFWLDENTGEITDVTSRSDVVQVVRCKDCKWQGNETDCPMFDPKMMKVDDFCSYGERKEE